VNMVWIYNTVTGAEAEYPESAVPLLRPSNWDVLSKKDVAAREQRAAEEARAAEAEMAEIAGAALPAEEQPEPQPNPRKSGSKKEND
jgi:hypothetical protein